MIGWLNTVAPDVAQRNGYTEAFYLCNMAGGEMAVKPQLVENETTIVFDKDGKTARIYTSELILQGYIEEEVGIKPYHVSKDRHYYIMPRPWLKWPRKGDR